MHPTLLFWWVVFFSTRFHRLSVLASSSASARSSGLSLHLDAFFTWCSNLPKVRIDRPRQPRQHPNNQQLHALWCELELLIGFNLVRLDAPNSHRRGPDHDDEVSPRRRRYGSWVVVDRQYIPRHQQHVRGKADLSLATLHHPPTRP
ncbi:hypothetical protein B0T18DRAFT_118049 [Schizothecium vesticola]|uniref:Secreted protein n=1 Tax=Schizothecium vesticola TaxID=314040 RepID=A0AA40K8I5_9PEZI|nr:hypothetical protein B0T18DRAFT_118049 [Schizothecium vesticola]